MKQIILTAGLFLLTTHTFATPVTCVEKVSTIVTQTRSVDLELGQRTALFSESDNISHITEKKSGFFSLELFMAEKDHRLYAEGTLDQKNPLNLVIWARDVLIEIQCTKESH